MDSTADRRLPHGLRVASLVLALLPLLSPLACDRAPSRPKPESGDVLLITVDTLRQDHVGLYGYARNTTPNIDHFFAQGAVFVRSYSTESKTPPSMVSILTGLLPQRHGVRMFYQLVPEATRLISDLLPDRYQSAAFVSSTPLTDDATGLARHFDVYDDFVDERESDRLMFERNARRTTDAVLDWLANARDPARPAFLWVHYIDPHGPYDPPPEARTRFEHDEPLPIPISRIKEYMRIEAAGDDGREYVDRYDDEIAYLDAEVGRLFEGFAASTDLSKALVILTADHGESLMDHEQWFRHGYHIYEELVRVPLLLRGAGVRPGRFRNMASGIDIAPTILRYTGGDVPGGLEGIDLRSVSDADDARSVVTEATAIRGQWKGVVSGDRKWMAYDAGDGGALEKERYYDLAVDPGEKRARSWPAASAQTRRLAELFASDPDPGGRPERMQEGVHLEAPKISPRANAEDIERLRALGYVD